MNLDFSNIKVLVIGDFMIDHYIIGESERMSPEAPVPVVIPKKEFSVPGGAANVAMNINSLGSNVTCLGFVGNDVFGEELVNILEENNINTKHIEIIENHPTTLKKRIYSNGNQIIRVDKEKFLNWKPSQLSSFDYNDYDIIILSDYNKGTLATPWFTKPENTNVILDPKNENCTHLFMNSNIITPNLKELKKLSDIEILNNTSISQACNKLIDKYNFDFVIAKKGEKGITIYGKQNFVKNIKPHNVFNPDVTGAGDTVIAALSISYAKSKDIEFSVKFANAAAAIAVGKSGTSTTTLREIDKLLSS